MINEEFVGMIVLGVWGVVPVALNERNLHDKSYERDPSHTREEEEDLDFNPNDNEISKLEINCIESLRIVRGTLWSALAD